MFCHIRDRVQHHRHHTGAWFIFTRPLHRPRPPWPGLMTRRQYIDLLIHKSVNKTGILTQFFTANTFLPQLKFQKTAVSDLSFNYQRYSSLWEKYLRSPSNYARVWLIFQHNLPAWSRCVHKNDWKVFSFMFIQHLSCWRENTARRISHQDLDNSHQTFQKTFKSTWYVLTRGIIS